MSAYWGGSLAMRARAYVATTLPAPCWRCHRMLYADQPWTWVAGHIIERDLRPDLAADPSNWIAECRPCYNRSGAVYGNRKRRRIASASRIW